MSDTTSACDLPPLPDHPEPNLYRWSALEREAITIYGDVRAEHEAIPLRERIAELERELKNHVVAAELVEGGYRRKIEEIDRLSAENEALRAIAEAIVSAIDAARAAREGNHD